MLRWPSQLSRSQQLCVALLAVLLVAFHAQHLLKTPFPSVELSFHTAPSPLAAVEEPSPLEAPSPLPTVESPSREAPFHPHSVEPSLAEPLSNNSVELSLPKRPLTSSSVELSLVSPPVLSPSPNLLALPAATGQGASPSPSTAPVLARTPPAVPGASPQPALSSRLSSQPDRGTAAARAGSGFTPLAWVPRPGRYLLLLCFRGQVSNIVRCLRNSVLAAGLLNRTLLIPRSISYQKDAARVWDLPLLWNLTKSEECLGKGTLQWMPPPGEGGAVRRGGASRLGRIGLINCWYGPRGVCRARDDGLSHSCPGKRGSRGRGRAGRREALAAAGAGAGAREIQPVPQFWSSQSPRPHVGAGTAAAASCLPRGAGLREFLAAFRDSEARVLSLGDLVLPDLPGIAAAAAGYRSSRGLLQPPATLPSGQPKGGELTGKSTEEEAPLAAFFQGDHPFAGQPGKCTSRLAIHPVSRFLEASEAMARPISGGHRFACVHWRRGDFAAYCGREKELRGHCTYGAPQAASCIAAALAPGHGGRADPNVSRVFLATNAGRHEVTFLKSALKSLSRGKLRVLRLSESPAASKILEEAKAQLSQTQRSFLDVIVDKLVCAQAALFIGSPFSTFSEDISWIRHGLRKQTQNDTTVCGGGEEWTSKEARAFIKRLGSSKGRRPRRG